MCEPPFLSHNICTVEVLAAQQSLNCALPRCLRSLASRSASFRNNDERRIVSAAFSISSGRLLRYSSPWGVISLAFPSALPVSPPR